MLQGIVGASVGKLILGLRVVNAQGETCGVGRAFVRWIFLLVDGFCFLVGLIVALATHPHRRVGDFVAGTYVVALASVGRPIASAPAGAAVSRYADPAPPGWTPPGAAPPPPGWGADRRRPHGARPRRAPPAWDVRRHSAAARLGRAGGRRAASARAAAPSARPTPRPDPPRQPAWGRRRRRSTPGHAGGTFGWGPTPSIWKSEPATSAGRAGTARAAADTGAARRADRATVGHVDPAQGRSGWDTPAAAGRRPRPAAHGTDAAAAYGTAAAPPADSAAPADGESWWNKAFGEGDEPEK